MTIPTTNDLLPQMLAPVVSLAVAACVILGLVELWRAMKARRRAWALPHVDGWHYRDSIARAASGHAVAAPPSSVMKSRRFTRSPRRRAAGETKARRDQVPWLSLA